MSDNTQQNRKMLKIGGELYICGIRLFFCGVSSAYWSDNCLPSSRFRISSRTKHIIRVNRGPQTQILASGFVLVAFGSHGTLLEKRNKEKVIGCHCHFVVSKEYPILEAHTPPPFVNIIEYSLVIIINSHGGSIPLLSLFYSMNGDIGRQSSDCWVRKHGIWFMLVKFIGASTIFWAHYIQDRKIFCCLLVPHAACCFLLSGKHKSAQAASSELECVTLFDWLIPSQLVRVIVSSAPIALDSLGYW